MDCVATSLFECGRLCCKLLPAGALCSHLIGGCMKGRGRSFIAVFGCPGCQFGQVTRVFNMFSTLFVKSVNASTDRLQVVL